MDGPNYCECIQHCSSGGFKYLSASSWKWGILMKRLLALLLFLPLNAEAQVDLGNNALIPGQCTTGTQQCADTAALGNNTREISTMGALFAATRPQLSAQVSSD